MSLILEFCSHGNLREYLHEHSNDFMQNMFSCQSNLNVIEPKRINHHSLSLLLRWSYQVIILNRIIGHLLYHYNKDSLVYIFDSIFHEVACGMEFISRKNIYHGDLAARNILITDQLVAKVSDFGLSQRLYQCLTPNNPHAGNVGYMKLPIKWLALEVLMHGQATTKSDVWSYGVLVWEILHLGAEPYRPGKFT